MSIVRRLALGLAACFGVGCGSRPHQVQQLLDPHLTDGGTLSVFVGVENGSLVTSGSHFNPTGTRTSAKIARADLYRVDFVLDRDSATLTNVQHVVGLDDKPLSEAITTADGFLSQVPPPRKFDAEIQCLAPMGNRFFVWRGGRYTVYADATKAATIETGVTKGGNFYFTWSGERLYHYEFDYNTGITRIHNTVVGSHGVWEELVYDPQANPVNADQGKTHVMAYDVLNGEPILLLQKQYSQREGGLTTPSPTYAVLHGQRLLSTWTGDPPGWIRPDLRAVVGWHRSYNSLQATLTLRSFDDGSLRSIAIDARPALTQARR